jgi:DNA-directed RNA polymerase specialized sigma24 family protein
MDYNELNIFIKKLFNTYFNKYRLNKELKEDIIQISMMKLFIKEEEGVLSGNVENNKNYIFITVRNELFMHFRINNRFKVDEEYDLTRFSFDLTIDNDMDKELYKNKIKDILKGKNYNDLEKYMIDKIMIGYKISEIAKELNLPERELNKIYSNIKSKIKTKINKKPKWLLIWNNGKKEYFFNKKEVLIRTGMCIDQFNNYLQLGKTKFKKYTIESI